MNEIVSTISNGGAKLNSPSRLEKQRFSDLVASQSSLNAIREEAEEEDKEENELENEEKTNYNEIHQKQIETIADNDYNNYSNDVKHKNYYFLQVKKVERPFNYVRFMLRDIVGKKWSKTNRFRLEKTKINIKEGIVVMELGLTTPNDELVIEQLKKMLGRNFISITKLLEAACCEESLPPKRGRYEV